MINLLAGLFLSFAFAGQDAGSGGDTILCKASPDNSFEGTYSLDYLMTYKSSNNNSDIVQVRSLKESLQRIRALIVAKLPEFLESYDEFTKLIRNEDVNQPRFWEEAPFGLVDIKDENIINLVPMNCRENGQVRITQAIIRLDPFKTGTSRYKLIYKYVPSIFDDLEKNRALQLSFLLIHEWLWDVSNNVETNRRLNRLFHSKELETMTRDQLREKLTVLGLQIPNVVPPPVFQFDACMPDVVSAQRLVRTVQNSITPLPTNYEVNRRVLPCADNRQGCLHSGKVFLYKPETIAGRIFKLMDSTVPNEVTFDLRYDGTSMRRTCRVDTTAASLTCDPHPDTNSLYAWFVPRGTIGRDCIRMTDLHPNGLMGLEQIVITTTAP